ncbi:MAG: chorismate-binding protein, partial [Sphingomonadaceae bacterium]|nr:chorismate-binding protein [Sphingomonadaceae bacterium]
MIFTDSPFVLLDDARVAHASFARLYSEPIRTLTAHSAGELRRLFEDLRTARANGQHVAGFLAYDAGNALLPQLLPPPDNLLAWFGIFEQYQVFEPDAMPSILPDAAGAWLSPLQSDISRADYSKAFAAAQEYIAAGDIYQANLTFPLSADYAGDPLALYAALRPRAAAGYGGGGLTEREADRALFPERGFWGTKRRAVPQPPKGRGGPPSRGERRHHGPPTPHR